MALNRNTFKNAPSVASICVAILLSITWMLIYWAILLPNPDTIGVVLNKYFSFSWVEIKTSELAVYFLNSQKNIFCLSLVTLFDCGVLLMMKAMKKDVPFYTGVIISFVLLALISVFLGIHSNSIGGKIPETKQVFLQFLFLTVLIAKFFSYLVPVKRINAIQPIGPIKCKKS